MLDNKEEEALALAVADEMISYCCFGKNIPSPENLAHCFGVVCQRRNQLPASQDDAERIVMRASEIIAEGRKVVDAMARALSAAA